MNKHFKTYLAVEGNWESAPFVFVCISCEVVHAEGIASIQGGYVMLEWVGTLSHAFPRVCEKKKRRVHLKKPLVSGGRNHVAYASGTVQAPVLQLV